MIAWRRRETEGVDSVEGVGRSRRAFISYAHEPASHREAVRRLWLLLRANDVDARCDFTAEAERQSWPRWMTDEIYLADVILVVASPEYRRRADDQTGGYRDSRAERRPAGRESRGVRWETRLIQDRFYQDADRGLREILPVLLPGGSPDDIPRYLAPTSSTFYRVAAFTTEGAEDLLRVLTGQPREASPPLSGRPPILPPQAGQPALSSPPAVPPAGTDRWNPSPRDVEVLVEALLAVDVMASADSRRQVVGQLRPGVAGSVRHGSSARLDILAIITACLDVPGAIEELLAAVRFLAGETYAVAALNETVERLGGPPAPGAGPT